MLVPFKVVLDNQPRTLWDLAVSSTLLLIHRGSISCRFLKKHINISLHLLALSFIIIIGPYRSTFEVRLDCRDRISFVGLRLERCNVKSFCRFVN